MNTSLFALTLSAGFLSLNLYVLWANTRFRKYIKAFRKDLIDLSDDYYSGRTLYAIEMYYGPRGTETRENFEKLRLEYPGRTPMCWLLFAIHSHAEIAYEENKDQIVYTETEITKLLQTLGIEVNWADQ